MAKFKQFFILFILLGGLGYSAKSQNYPPRPEPAVYVNDFAEIFQDFQRSELEAMLIDYYDSTSTQIVVVTMKSLDGMAASQYAVELGEKWGIGQADKDNGVLFLIAPKERTMFILTGRGTQERLTDVFIGRIRDNYILPEFKVGNYYSGVRLGIIQMMNRLSGSFQSDNNSTEDGEISLGLLLMILLIIFLVMWFLGKLAKGMNYSETYSGRGYRDNWGGGGFWGTGGGSSWGGSGSWGSGSSGGSFGGGSFDGGGAGGSW